jgi:hypothetical protein
MYPYAENQVTDWMATLPYRATIVAGATPRRNDANVCRLDGGDSGNDGDKERTEERGEETSCISAAEARAARLAARRARGDREEA